MEFVAEKWKFSILYLGFIYSIIFLLHSLISHKLLLGYQAVQIKNNPDLPLRFRSDGTFKILQVCVMGLFFNSISGSFSVWNWDFCYARSLICILPMELTRGVEMCWISNLNIARILTRLGFWREWSRRKILISLLLQVFFNSAHVFDLRLLLFLHFEVLFSIILLDFGVVSVLCF